LAWYVCVPRDARKNRRTEQDQSGNEVHRTTKPLSLVDLHVRDEHILQQEDQPPVELVSIRMLTGRGVDSVASPTVYQLSDLHKSALHRERWYKRNDRCGSRKAHAARAGAGHQENANSVAYFGTQELPSALPFHATIQKADVTVTKPDAKGLYGSADGCAEWLRFEKVCLHSTQEYLILREANHLLASRRAVQRREDFL
jgi:hypothetical protein